MTPEQIRALIEALDGLAEQAGGDEGVSPEDVASAVQSAAQPVYQHVWNAGHRTATASEREGRDKLQRDLAAAQQRAQTAEQRIQELEEDQPDVAELRREHERQIEQIRQEHQDEVEGLKTARMKDRKSRTMSDLVSILVAKHKIDPVYARALVRDPEQGVESRLRFPEDGELQVLQKPSTDGDSPIPYAPKNGENPLDILAGELEQHVPPNFKGGGGDRGSGTGGSGGGGGGENVYDSIRKRRQEERKESAKAPFAGADALAGRPSGQN